MVMGESDAHLTKEIAKRLDAGGTGGGNSKANGKQPIEPIKKKEEDEQIYLLKKDYDALVNERDQLKVNLYLLGTNLKETGFQISDSGNGIQKLGNDIVTRIRLTPEQMAMIQKQIQQ